MIDDDAFVEVIEEYARRRPCDVVVFKARPRVDDRTDDLLSVRLQMTGNVARCARVNDGL